jgi:hypothetical protein
LGSCWREVMRPLQASQTLSSRWVSYIPDQPLTVQYHWGGCFPRDNFQQGLLPIGLAVFSARHRNILHLICCAAATPNGS